MSAARQFLQSLAVEVGCNVGDLLVLAPANDPFNCGTVGDREKAEWFAQQWSRVGLSHGVHLRRIHYSLLSTGRVLCRDGTPYINTLECWQDLNVCSKAARYLGLVSLDAFDDRRNPPPVLVKPRPASAGGVAVSGYLPGFDPGDLTVHWPSLTCTLPTFADDFHLEIWCEKSTMNDVLLPLCERFNATLVTGLGELSITAVDRLVQRMRARCRPCRLFYISDFDPGGQSMPVAVARKAQFMLWNEGKEIDEIRDLRIYPLVLTRSQVEAFGLPRTPIKASERRRESFESRHGAGATELDALEAIYPGRVKKIITTALQRYEDRAHWSRLQKAQADVQRQCERINEQVLAAFADRMVEAEAELQRRIDAVADWRGENAPIFEAIEERLYATAPDSPAWPARDYPTEPTDSLFDSTRSYVEQQDHYRAFQSGDQP